MAAPLSGRTAIVTGANSGIGLETARGLARMGAHVVMACRSPERAETALREVQGSAPEAHVETMRLDLASLDDVRRFARAFRERHARLHVLVNNAGIHTARRETTPDGHERTFAVNHLGHFLLTNLLRDVLEASAPARVVNVASDAHLTARLDFDDLMATRAWSGIRQYQRSKLANILFSNELARRLEGTGVTSNALHPGSVRSNWARGEESGVFRFGVALAAPFLLTPQKGARTSLHVASAPELEGVTGRYFRRCRQATPSRAARDPDAARRLWDASARLVGLERSDAAP